MQPFTIHGATIILSAAVRGEKRAAVSRFHEYAKEFEYRFNARENPSSMFPRLVSQLSKPQFL